MFSCMVGYIPGRSVCSLDRTKSASRTKTKLTGWKAWFLCMVYAVIQWRVLLVVHVSNWQVSLLFFYGKLHAGSMVRVICGHHYAQYLCFVSRNIMNVVPRSRLSRLMLCLHSKPKNNTQKTLLSTNLVWPSDHPRFSCPHQAPRLYKVLLVLEFHTVPIAARMLDAH